MIRATLLLVFVSLLIFPAIGVCGGAASMELISTDPASPAVLSKTHSAHINLIDGKIGEVGRINTTGLGDIYGGENQCDSKLHLGKLRKNTIIQLADRRVTQSLEHVPVIKVRVAYKSETVDGGRIGWVKLASTTFADKDIVVESVKSNKAYSGYIKPEVLSLSDEALLALDYTERRKARIVAKRDTPGAGVEFDIYYPPNEHSFISLSSRRQGDGVLTDIDLNKYIAYELKYSLVGYECKTPVPDNAIIVFGSYIGGRGSYRPESIKLSGGEPKKASTIIQPGKMPRCEMIGFTAYLLKSNFKNTEGITITLKLEATPGTHQVRLHKKPVRISRKDVVPKPAPRTGSRVKPKIKPRPSDARGKEALLVMLKRIEQAKKEGLSQAQQEKNRNKKTVVSKTLSSDHGSIDSRIAKKHCKKYEGVWVYRLKGTNGRPDKEIILQGKCHESGQLRFSFLGQPAYPGAVFYKCSVDQFRANVYFNLNYNRYVMYCLTRNKQGLSSTIHTSWAKEQKVSLRKITLAQATKALENNSHTITGLISSIKRIKADAKVEKDKYQANIKELGEVINQLQRQNVELKKKQQDLQRENGRLKTELNDVRNSKLAVEKQHQSVVKELSDKVSEIYLQIDKYSQETSDPVNLQEVMSKGSTLGAVDEEVSAVQSAVYGSYVWQILYDLPKGTKVRVRLKHAAAGSKGAFQFTAWCDADGDGVPDSCIGTSALKVAENKNDWSDWEFVSTCEKVFVGVTMKTKGSLYYQIGGKPKGYFGLSNKVFYAKPAGGKPQRSVQPRYINLRVEILEAGKVVN